MTPIMASAIVAMMLWAWSGFAFMVWLAIFFKSGGQALSAHRSMKRAAIMFSYFGFVTLVMVAAALGEDFFRRLVENGQ